MEPIKQGGGAADNKPKTAGELIDRSNRVKKKVARGILNNTGIFVGVFLVFIVVVVFTTDIQLGSFANWAALGLAFFILLFCSYSMYVNFSDTGTRAGKDTTVYTKALEDYDAIKREIIADGQQGRLLEFCRYYVQEELLSTRHAIVADVGVDFKLYKEKYMGMSKESLAAEQNLTEPQRKAIIKANNIKPIKLTPEMIFKRGRGSEHRAPLGANPTKKKAAHYIIKFIKISTTTLLTSVIVLDVIIKPNWATFAACCLKLMPVILNGFMGYKMGYENIVYDTVNYMNDQMDLLRRFQLYVKEHPVREEYIEEDGNVAPIEAVESAIGEIEETARDDDAV